MLGATQARPGDSLTMATIRWQAPSQSGYAITEWDIEPRASALLLIRKQDFVRTGEPQAAAVPGAAAGADSSSPARSA